MNTDSILENRKYYQRNKMLNIIRFNKHVSRNDIKKLTSYSMTTVINTIDEMIRDGLIVEDRCQEARVGRKPIWLKLNPSAGYFVGVEFNARKIHCVVLDFCGCVIYNEKKLISNNKRDANDVIDAIIFMLGEALKFLENDKDKVFGIGIGVPGYSDKKTGVAISYNHFDNWHNISIKKIIEDKFKIKCHMDNNVNIMIYAYKWLVYNGKCEDMLFVSVRTGARVMPVINNVPVSSEYGFPGELGHVKVAGSSRICSCGRYGCLNSEISDYSVVNKIKDGIRVGRFKEIYAMVSGNVDEISISTFVDSVLNRHEDSLELMKQIAGFLAQSLSMLVNIFAPSLIVFYGELSRIGEPFLRELKEKTMENAISANSQRLKIVISKFGENLGAVGAASLVLQESFDFVEEMI